MWGIQRRRGAKVHTVITVRISVDQNLSSPVVKKKKAGQSYTLNFGYGLTVML